jgi:four helix bundle protein
MTDFEHERLDVYRTAIEWLIVADEIAADLPRGRAYLAEQLRRAATSVSLNIAEGAGEFSPGDKARFYRMARRSATECAATLDACRVTKITSVERVLKGRELLLRVVALLTVMVLKLGASGSGSGSS